MTFVAHLPGYKQYNALKDSAFRMGVYIGLCLFATFAVWLVIANRMPLFERFALERNSLAAAIMCLFAALPVLRFIRRPSKILVAGGTAWAIFSFLYRVIALFFVGLHSWHSAWQVFVEGVLVYLIIATLSWMVGFVLRVRAAHSTSRQNHQLT